MDKPQKIALVTGAGTGIGRGVARGLSLDGYAIAMFGRRRHLLEETAGMLEGEALVFDCDVGDPDAVRSGYAAIQERFGRLDLLFNNAGVAIMGLPDGVGDEQWQAVVSTNLNGSYFCAREAFKMMRHQSPMGGRIINNGSVSAHAPRPASIAYTATKHAITGLTRSLSLDGRPFNIACGQIDIGNADTGLVDIMKGRVQPDGERRTEPVMEVADVVEAVRMMAALPLSANVQFLTVTATKMPFIGRG